MEVRDEPHARTYLRRVGVTLDLNSLRLASRHILDRCGWEPIDELYQQYLSETEWIAGEATGAAMFIADAACYAFGASLMELVWDDVETRRDPVTVKLTTSAVWSIGEIDTLWTLRNPGDLPSDVPGLNRVLQGDLSMAPRFIYNISVPEPHQRSDLGARTAYAVNSTSLHHLGVALLSGGMYVGLW